MAELAASEILFDSLADDVPVAVFVSDADGSCIYANERLCELLGRPSADILAGGWAEALHPDDAERVQAEWAQASIAALDIRTGYRFVRPDGDVRWVEASARAVRDKERRLLGWVGSCIDVTALKLSERRFEALAWMNIFDVLGPADGDRERKTFERRVSRGLVEQDGKAIAIETIARDASQWHEFMQKLRHEATYDGLTGLPNRTLFHDRLSLALARATRDGSKLAVMVLDVDGFKRVNDSLGHAVGDDLLVRLAPRLEQELRESDSIARLGGDEFGFLFEDIGEQGLPDLAERLLAAVAETTPQHQLQKLTASLGIAVPELDDTTETALSNADSAMYSAKKAGPGRFEVYEETMRSHLVRDLAITEAVASTLENNQLQIYYQPIVSLTDGRILAMETLARVTHPELGRINPGEFIPVAEEHGLIVALGQQIFDDAARNATLWRARYPNALPLGIFVNTSPYQLGQPDFVEQFLDTLNNHATGTTEIGIEITERVFIDHDEQLLLENLNRLQDLGVRMSLDDFGTGYASLTALKQLPLTALKIDRSFIAEIRDVDADAPITHASVTLGHALGLTVIAEGVETEIQAEYLRGLGCDAAQGYHYGRPQPARHAATLLQAERHQGHAVGQTGARSSRRTGA